MTSAPANTDTKHRRILGVRFFVGSPEEAVDIGLAGGLVVVPAAPALVDMKTDAAYRDSLVNADLAITDSGFMILIWRLMTGEKLTRVSGLEYLKLLLDKPALREKGNTLWIMPTPGSMKRNLAWLNANGFPTTEGDCFLAPMYGPGPIVDEGLLKRVQDQRPAHIVVCLGGGVQERLGHYLRQNAAYRPGIHCIGAAIGFLSGDQVPIPMWADYFFLGWFFRCLSAPSKFVPRYWKARHLFSLMFKYKDRLPVG